MPRRSSWSAEEIAWLKARLVDYDAQNQGERLRCHQMATLRQYLVKKSETAIAQMIKRLRQETGKNYSADSASGKTAPTMMIDDGRFAAAMEAAIKSGQERAPVGTSVTPGTKRPRAVPAGVPYIAPIGAVEYA